MQQNCTFTWNHGREKKKRKNHLIIHYSINQQLEDEPQKSSLLAQLSQYPQWKNPERHESIHYGKSICRLKQKNEKPRRAQHYMLSRQAQRVPFCPIGWIWTKERMKGQTISTKRWEFGSSQVLPRSVSCRKIIWYHVVMLAHSVIKQQYNVSENVFKKSKYWNRSKLSRLCKYRIFSLLPERSQTKRSISVSPIFDNVERCMHRLQMQLLFLIKCFLCLLSSTNLKTKAINHSSLAFHSCNRIAQILQTR